MCCVCVCARCFPFLSSCPAFLFFSPHFFSFSSPHPPAHLPPVSPFPPPQAIAGAVLHKAAESSEAKLCLTAHAPVGPPENHHWWQTLLPDISELTFGGASERWPAVRFACHVLSVCFVLGSRPFFVCVCVACCPRGCSLFDGQFLSQYGQLFGLRVFNCLCVSFFLWNDESRLILCVARCPRLCSLFISQWTPFSSAVRLHNSDRFPFSLRCLLVLFFFLPLS